MNTSQPPEGTNRPDPTQSDPEPNEPHTGAGTYVGPETWVREAIAEQEAHIKRWRSCMDTLGRPHSYRDMTASPNPAAPDEDPIPSVTYRACATCGVTETREDYQTQRQARGGRSTDW